MAKIAQLKKRVADLEVENATLLAELAAANEAMAELAKPKPAPARK